METTEKQNTLKEHPRWYYLHYVLHLDHDPFAGSTAEQDASSLAQPELIRERIKADPPFYDYFVEPPFVINDDVKSAPKTAASLLSLLLENRPVIVFGDPGSGKTMLRYVLEHQIRFAYEHTLVVSHNLGKGPRDWVLAESLAIDLFIQTVERFASLDIADEALRSRLWRYWQIHIPHLETVLSSLLADKEAARSLTGIARWWRWDRPVVRNIQMTEPLRDFLEAALYAAQPENHTEKACSLADGIELAGRLGFQQVYFLVDAAGSGLGAFKDWQNSWKQLKQQLDALPSLPLYVKYFLPPHFQDSIIKEGLPSETISVILSWNDAALEQLIANRFRSAKRWMRSFDALSDIPGLNAQMIVAAAGSPRRLVQIASALIDAHAGRLPDAPLLTAEDWQNMRQQWGGSSPPPPISEQPEKQQ